MCLPCPRSYQLVCNWGHRQKEVTCFKGFLQDVYRTLSQYHLVGSPAFPQHQSQNIHSHFKPKHGNIKSFKRVCECHPCKRYMLGYGRTHWRPETSCLWYLQLKETGTNQITAVVDVTSQNCSKCYLSTRKDFAYLRSGRGRNSRCKGLRLIWSRGHDENSKAFNISVQTEMGAVETQGLWRRLQSVVL